MAKAQTAAPQPAEDVIIRLDRSKKFSTVHGDRTLDDPHGSVVYIQDSLPFDGDGILVPDDGKTEPWDMVHDGQRIRHFPLYTLAMREKLKRKIERVTKGLPKDEVSEHDDDAIKEDAAEDVNLESWLRGEVKYPPFMIYAACKKRFSKNYTRLRDVLDDLVLDEKIIPESQVDPKLLQLMGA